MNQKDQFLAAVFAAALARDLRDDTADAQLVARFANAIPADKIPTCPINAAKVFLHYCGSDHGRPYRWMVAQPSSPPRNIC